MKRKFFTALALTIVSATTFAATDSMTNAASDTATSASADSTIQVTPFESLDTNKDGYLNEQEAQAVPLLGSNFNQIEFDGDGRIDKLGYYAILSLLTTGIGPHMPSFGVLDVSRDGNVTETEYKAFELRLRQVTTAMSSGKLGIGLTPTPNTLDGNGGVQGAGMDQGMSGKQ